jgi:hypothetical protein
VSDDLRSDIEVVLRGVAAEDAEEGTIVAALDDVMQAVEASESWCWQRGLLTRCTLLRLEHILADDYTSSSDLESEEGDA